MADLMKLGIIYKALEEYDEFMNRQNWSQSMFRSFGRPNKPACTVKALAIVKHDRVLNGRD